MESSPPPSWRRRFEEAARAYGSAPLGTPGPIGPRALAEESVDAYIETFPIESYHDETAREALDDLHRGALRLYVLYRIGFLSNELEWARDLCESPIEAAMLYALALVSFEYADSVTFRGTDGLALGGDAEPGSEIEIEPQAQLGEHRVDFLLTYRRMTRPEQSDPARPALLHARPRLEAARLIVECDGHDYHDRTKKQASTDRARDRSLQSFGLSVYRYTGSDIWQHPFRCAVSAVAALLGRLDA